MLMVGRAFRFLVFVGGIVIGVVVTLFAVDNQESIGIRLWSYSFSVPVFALALVPLAAGLLAGWAYTVPARAHEFADHWRSWRTLRRMEKENKELRRSLDKVLELPDDAAPALPAPERPQLPPATAAEPAAVHDVEPEAVHEVEAAAPKAVHPAKPAHKPAARRTPPARRKRARVDLVELATVARPAPAGKAGGAPAGHGKNGRSRPATTPPSELPTA